MSYFGETVQEKAVESLPERFSDCSMNFDTNKPDSKDFYLDSPNSVTVSRKSRSATSIPVAATSSSSSSSSGSVSGKPKQQKSHSDELFGLTETAESARSVATTRSLKPGHRRSVSAGVPLIYSGRNVSVSHGTGCNVNVNSATSVSSHSSPNNVLPSGNICPSGKIMKSSLMANRNTTRTDVLRSGLGNYGHGSIMRSSNAKLSNVGVTNPDLNSSGEAMSVKRVILISDPEEMKKAGNEMYKKGNFLEALSLYDQAISIAPEKAAYRSNRAAALTAVGRLGEAVKECEEAVSLDPGYCRAHQRLASLYIRLGHVENARRHLNFPGQQPDQLDLQNLHSLEEYLNRCADARKIGDWKSTLRDCNAAISAGADYSPHLIACRAEALLKLHQVEDANSSLSNIPKIEHQTTSMSQTKFFGMFGEAYLLYVRAHLEMAMGRFESAVSMAEKAALIDYSNIEVSKFLNNVKLVARARALGNDLFSEGRFSEASTAYREGLKYDSFNSVLLCNRAVCWSKMGVWEQSVEDCNQALKIQPNYTKALLRRAASNGKLGRWAEAVRDYEVLRKQLPGDNKVAESLFHAQTALKKSREDEVNVKKFSCQVEEVINLEQFKMAISSPCVSVIYFRMASNLQCEQISSFVNTLCLRYPSINFLKVDIDEIPIIAKSESIRSVPTFKIYKNGRVMNEMICPSHQVLEYSIKHYNL